MKNFFTLILFTTSFSVFAQDPALKPFYHGVASGDALSDRVIIWTRVTPDVPGTLSVNWLMATDTIFTNIVNSGTVTTDSTKDFTVKVDVTGLQSDTWYYYQFSINNKKSLIGRAKTLPTGNNQHIRVAVASCESYETGVYYNAWLSIATRNDIQAVIFLGDYVYETAEGGASGTGVTILPDHDIITVEDYRQRYNSYRLDPYLRRAHQQYTFYNVWDDHEVANNSWTGGSNPATPGDYQVRKANAQRVYFEWIPIREQSPGSHSIYRSFNFGNLADFIMLDTRHEGRNEQVSTTNTAALEDTNRTILGTTQRQWFFDQLDNSQAQWRIVGQQVMIAPLKIFGSYVNNDQWDGYQGDRNRVTDHIVSNSVQDVVWLTGDIHSSWANDIPQQGVTYNASTGAGSAFVEFVGTSITSGGVPVAGLESVIMGQNTHMKWLNLTQRGYMVVDIDTERVQCDWYLVSTVTSANFTVDTAASWYVNNGERFLRQASAPAATPSNSAPFAPQSISPASGIKEIPVLPVSVFPNPFEKNIVVELREQVESAVMVRIFNIHGKKMYEVNVPSGRSLGRMSIDTNALLPGDYLLTVESGNAASRVTIVKTQ